MHVLITGVTGFIGSSLANYLYKKGYAVSGLARSSAIKSMSFLQDKIIFDFDGEEKLPSLSQFDVILHLASKVSSKNGKNKDEYEHHKKINAEGTKLIAAKAAEDGVEKFILISSLAVNGKNSGSIPFTSNSPNKPYDAYSQSKAQAEKYLMEIADATDLTYVIIRPPMVYGPNSSGSFSSLKQLVLRKIPLPFKGWKGKRSFLYVLNLCGFLEHCLKSKDVEGKVLLVTDGPAMSLEKFLRMVYAAANIRPFIFYLPTFLTRILSKVARKADFVERLSNNCEIDFPLDVNTGWLPEFTTQQGLEKSVYDQPHASV